MLIQESLGISYMQPEGSHPAAVPERYRYTCLTITKDADLSMIVLAPDLSEYGAGVSDISSEDGTAAADTLLNLEVVARILEQWRVPVMMQSRYMP